MSRPQLLGMLALLASLSAQQDLPQLVDRLAGADAQQRSQAYQELQRRRDPAVLPLLLPRLEGMPTAGQSLAFYLLQQLPVEQTKPHYEKLLRSAVQFVRAAAAAALLRQPGRQGDAALLQTLAAATAAAAPTELQPLLNLLHGFRSPELAAALRQHLASAPVATMQQLLQRLLEIEQGTSASTVAALQSLRQPGATGTAASSDASSDASSAAGSAAGRDAAREAAILVYLLRSGDPAAAPALTALLQQDPARFFVVRTLFDADQKLPGPLAEVIALALQKPRQKFDIEPTARLLHRSAADLTLRSLRKLLDDGSDNERAGALAALAVLPGGLDLPRLRGLLTSQSEEVRLTAAVMLRRRDDTSGLPVALAIAAKPGPQRVEAARTLGGFRQLEVIAPLLDLLDAPELPVRQQAWTSLQQVWRDLFPYRRFDFDSSGYRAEAADRTAALQLLRAWWASLRPPEARR